MTRALVMTTQLNLSPVMLTSPRALLLGLALLLAPCLPRASPLGDVAAPGGADAPGAPAAGVDFDARLTVMSDCEDVGTNSYRWSNPELMRVGRKSIAVSAELEVLETIPDTPTFSITANLTNRKGNDRTGEMPVVDLVMIDLCKKMADKGDEGMQHFIKSVDSGFGGKCPIEPGNYKINKFEFDLDGVKAFLREGVMRFKIAHNVNGALISCMVAEFDVQFKEPL